MLPRRRFLALSGAGLALGAGMMPRPAFAGERTVLLIGGSTIKGGLGIVLARLLEERGWAVERWAKSATGLARPDFFNWPERAGELYAEHGPVATLVMFGGNDGQGLYMGHKAEPRWIRWGEEGWNAEYRRRVDALNDVLAPQGEKVVWIGMPIVASPKLRTRLEVMNQIIADAAEARSGIEFIDTWDEMADAQGRYVDHMTMNGASVLVRSPDGVHLTPSGSNILAARIVDAIDAHLEAPRVRPSRAAMLPCLRPCHCPR